MNGTNITIINICDKQDSQRSASRFLPRIDDKWEHRKSCWNLSGAFSSFLYSFACLKTAFIMNIKQHNIFQLVVESTSFTDITDVNSLDHNFLYVSSVKISG